MTKEEFRRLAQSGLLFLDGATGSNLQKQGMPVGVCPELWITEHEEIMSGLQKAYLEAGTNILYAPTFTANRIKLKEFDLEDRIEELNHKLVEISKRAADGKALVAGDLTMTGQQLKPMGPLDFEELIDVYKEQIRYITEAGADLLVVETMMSLQESRAALIAAKETCPDIPVGRKKPVRDRCGDGGDRFVESGRRRGRRKLFNRTGSDGRGHPQDGEGDGYPHHRKAKRRTSVFG